MKRLILNGVSLWLIDLIFDGIVISDAQSLIALTLMLALCNMLIKPFLQFFSFPLTLLSLGLFSLIINGIVLSMAFQLVPGAAIGGLGTAVLASIVLSVVNGALTDMFGSER
ncbi:MAG: phage holin family protein [Erysipelotrichaceae bacterium]|nr:phage holin family protein [Erysipelotrichaceae bacterium]